MIGVRKAASGRGCPVEGMVCAKARAIGVRGGLAWGGFLAWATGAALAVPCNSAFMR